MSLGKCDICKHCAKCKKTGDDRLLCQAPDFEMRVKIKRKKVAFHKKNNWMI